MNQKDLDTMLEIIHIPEDAGEYADDIQKILSRIPPRWGRWISCDKGWYPLVIELDQKLAEIYPDYQLHQVKEKFGTLRYYVGFPDLKTQLEIEMKETQPIPGTINPRWLRTSDGERTAQQQYELDKWYYEKYLPMFDSEEYLQQYEELEPERQRRVELSKKMEETIQEYENLSAVTCELCGADAQVLARSYWYKTLCPTCADKEGYLPIPDEESTSN